jgi:hypothetical protein
MEVLQFKCGKEVSSLQARMNVKTQVLDLKNPGNDSKVDWHLMLNFGIIITDYEGNIIELFMSLQFNGFFNGEFVTCFGFRLRVIFIYRMCF